LEEGSTNPQLGGFLAGSFVILKVGILILGISRRVIGGILGRRSDGRGPELEGKQKREEDYPEILEILDVLVSLEQDWKIYEKDDPCFPF